MRLKSGYVEEDEDGENSRLTPLLDGRVNNDLSILRVTESALRGVNNDLLISLGAE
jgi:hypothetical protein